MPTNLELKARIRSVAVAHESARRLGAAFAGELRQRDTYFHVPRGRLKLREEDGARAELIQYERNEETEERWSSYERMHVPEPPALFRILEPLLGVKAVVEKSRSLYLFRNARIHIDAVRGLGEFLEFEIVDGSEGESVALMGILRDAFSVEDADVLRVSYADLMLAKTGSGKA